MKRYVPLILAGAGMALIIGAAHFSAPPKPMPPLPDSIPSQLGWVPVHVVPGLVCGGVPAYGCFSPNVRLIEIRDSINLSLAWMTLEHERLHMILFDADTHFAPAVEDHLGDVIGAARVTEVLARQQ